MLFIYTKKASNIETVYFVNIPEKFTQTFLGKSQSETPTK